VPRDVQPQESKKTIFKKGKYFLFPHKTLTKVYSLQRKTTLIFFFYSRCEGSDDAFDSSKEVCFNFSVLTDGGSEIKNYKSILESHSGGADGLS